MMVVAEAGTGRGRAAATVTPAATSGDMLRRYRIRAGFTQQELADRARLSIRAVRYLEQGRSGRPQATSVHKLATALGLPAGDLAALLETADPVATPANVHIGVLGPLRLRHHGRPVDIGSARLRTLLGLLAIQPRQTVTIGEIVDVLWGDDPPRTCVDLVHTYVGRLRDLLDPDRRAAARPILRRSGGGYRLEAGRDQLDLLAMEHQLDRARDANEPDVLWTAYRDAWQHWRGPPLAGADPRLREHPATVAVAVRRLTILQQYADLALTLHRAAEALPALRTVHSEEPLHEGIAARLMLVLAGDGQPAAALELFESVRNRLDDELGMPPGPELRAAQLSVLRGDAPVRQNEEVAAPAQLPPDSATFTGRDSDLETLDRLVPAGEDTPAVVVITGMGGVGKTSLAVRWARRVRDRFPDGQLYVNLRGHARLAPLRALDALAGFLPWLGVPEDQVPDDEAAAAALYRTRLAGRRVLVLLDNAHDADQVRPLLATGGGSLSLVTARSALAGLVARDGARTLPLGLLDPDSAGELLAVTLGGPRVEAEPDAVGELIRLCAGLPLALRIAAANLAGRPRNRIADYATRLASGDRLTALAVDGDTDTAVRAAFALSYAALPVPDRRMFRLLSVVPGPDITAEVAAAAAGTDRATTERVLDRLADHHLVDEHAPGRYTLHDLLRLYAAERDTAESDAGERREAIDRVTDHYLRTVVAAADLLYPHLLRLPSPDGPPPDGTGLASARDALSWLDDERPNLVTLTRHLADSGRYAAATRLADLLNGYFMLRGNPVDWQVTAEVGLAAATAANDPAGQAAAHISLSSRADAQSRFTQSEGHSRQALELARAAGWSAGEAVAINNLARIHWIAGRIPETIAQLTAALAVNRAAGRRVGEAVALANLGVAYRELARCLTGSERRDALDRARDHLGDALAIHREIGDERNAVDTQRHLAAMHRDLDELAVAREWAADAVRLGERCGDLRHTAAAQGTLASILTRLGQDVEAVAHHRAAVATAVEIGDRQLHATILLEAAEAYQRIGRTDAAGAAATEALALAGEIGSRLLARHAEAILAAPGARVRPDP